MTIKRSLATRDPFDVQFAGSVTVPVAFAVWDGSMRDRNGQKAFSGWQRLVIE